MQYSKNEVITGATVLAGIALFVLLLIGLGNLSSLFTSRYKVYVYFNQIGYLSANTKVLQAGVEIGEVAAIEQLKPGHEVKLASGKKIDPPPAVRVTLLISEGATISPDAPVYIDTKGMLGDPFIAIGSGPVPIDQAIGEGEGIQGQDAMSMVLAMSRMSQAVEDTGIGELDLGELQRKVGAVLHSATEVMGTAKGKLDEFDVKQIQSELTKLLHQGNGFVASASALISGPTVARTFANLERVSGNFSVLSASLTRDFNRLRDNLDGVLANARDLMTNVNGIVERNGENIDETLVNVRELTALMNQKLGPMIDSANGLVSKLDDFTGDNRDELDAIMANLRDFTANAETFSRTLAEEPWQLIWKGEKRRVLPGDAPEWKEDAP